MKTFSAVAILLAQSSALTINEYKMTDIFSLGDSKHMVTVASMNAEGNYASIQCTSQCCPCASCCDCPCSGGASAGPAGSSVEQQVIDAVAKQTAQDRKIKEAIEEYKEKNGIDSHVNDKKMEEAKAVAEEAKAAAGAAKEATEAPVKKAEGKAGGKGGKKNGKGGKGGKDAAAAKEGAAATPPAEGEAPAAEGEAPAAEGEAAAGGKLAQKRRA